MTEGFEEMLEERMTKDLDLLRCASQFVRSTRETSIRKAIAIVRFASLRLVMKLLFFECEGPVEVVLYLRELYAKLLHAASKS